MTTGKKPQPDPQAEAEKEARRKLTKAIRWEYEVLIRLIIQRDRIHIARPTTPEQHAKVAQARLQVERAIVYREQDLDRMETKLRWLGGAHDQYDD